MRIGVHFEEVTPAWGGAHTFVTEILSALDGAAGGHRFEVLAAGSAPAPVSGLAWHSLPDPGEMMSVRLERAAERLGIELLWSLTPRAPAVELPFVATVWDLEHRNQPFFPEVSSSGWRWEERDRHYRATLPRAAWVNVGSEAARRQLGRCYGLAPEQVEVVALPVPTLPEGDAVEEAAWRSAHGVVSLYFYYPAQFWPHKNHVVLLDALKLLAEGHGLRPQLVLTGEDRGNLRHVREVAAELGVGDQVRHLGFVERRRVAALYRGARALLFPSLFGPDNFPPLEARALGCPVIASALPGARELLGDGFELVEPCDERAWAAAIAVHVESTSGERDARRSESAPRARWSGVSYVEAFLARADRFAKLRRCWSARERYEHT